MRKFLKQLLNKRLKNEKGLTLIELLAVIVILGIIAAIAVPAIGNIINDTKLKAAKADIVSVLNASNLYFTNINAENGTVATRADLEPYIDNWGVLSHSSIYLKVEKGEPNKLSVVNSAGTVKTITVGGKTVTVTNATVDNLNLDNASSTTGFNY